MVNAGVSQYYKSPRLALLFLLLSLNLSCYGFSGPREISAETVPFVNGDPSSRRTTAKSTVLLKLKSPRFRSTPQQIRIPAIGLNIRVTALSFNPDPSVESPEDYPPAGWWTGGTYSSDSGPAIIAGRPNAKNSSKVFDDLQKLRPGHTIHVIGSAGHIMSFKVDQLLEDSQDQFPTQTIEPIPSEPFLRLVAYSPPLDAKVGHHHRDNFIVIASLDSMMLRF